MTNKEESYEQYIDEFVQLSNGHIVFVEDFDGDEFFGTDDEGREHFFKENFIQAICSTTEEDIYSESN